MEGKNNEEIIDLSEEEIVPEEDLENTSVSIKKLRDRLKKCEEEKQEYLDGWQRLKADSINNRKQAEKEKKEFIKYAGQKIISELLPSLDHFESAISTEINESTSNEWKKGVENTYKELKKALSQNGLEEINPSVGTDFDPSLHEAIGLEEVSDQTQDNKIVEVLQRGFKLEERVLRAAKVKVGEYRS